MHRIILSLILFLSIITLNPKEIVAKNNELVIGMKQFPSTMHPTIDSMMAKTYILGMVQRPFTLYNHKWELECMLCDKLPSFEDGTARTRIKEDGSEAISAIYKIKDDIFWGDGVPVTTKDVIFSWEVGKHKLSGVSNFELYAKDINNIRVIDDKSFEIDFDKSTCDFRAIDDFRVLPEHIEKAIFEEDPKTYMNRTLYDIQPENAGLYFGPYIITKVNSGSSFTLAKNKYWQGKKPYFEKITIKIIENSQALSANLLSGEIDYIAGELGLSIDQAISLERRIKRQNKFDVIYKQGLIYEHIDINHDNPILKDKEIRQALLYAIDRKSISMQLFNGKQPVADNNVNPLDKVHNPDIKKYSYDIKKSAELFDKNGWKLNDDGFRYKDGKKLSVQQMTTAGDKTRELIQQAIQSDWKKIGVESIIDNEPARVFFGETTRKRKYKDTAMYAWLSSPKNIPKTTLHSDMIPSEKNNFAGQNYVGYKNDKLDKILDDLETVCEPKANQELWNNLQDIYSEELPALPLYFRADSYIIPKWLKGVRPTGHQYPTSLWIEEWIRE